MLVALLIHCGPLPQVVMVHKQRKLPHKMLGTHIGEDWSYTLQERIVLLRDLQHRLHKRGAQHGTRHLLGC